MGECIFSLKPEDILWLFIPCMIIVWVNCTISEKAVSIAPYYRRKQLQYVLAMCLTLRINLACSTVKCVEAQIAD